MTLCRFFAATGVLLALAGCATGLQRNSDIAPVSDVDTATFPVDERVVPERYVSPAHPGVELDSLATWLSPEGETRVIASGKHGGVLLVFDGEAPEGMTAVDPLIVAAPVDVMERTDVDEAQKAIMQIVRQMAANGDIVIAGGADDYV